MKKVVLALAVVFGVAMVSCSDKKAEAADTDSVVAVEDTAVVVEEVANDSDTAIVAAAEVAEAPAAEEAAK
ncbi:MAG: hypothetical protein HDR95_05470 [Bacteroides sp.]|nr:hypothetical protein [Bacteroidales bacterium]MBD5283817.1 hypothetical protein [Bacteroides sp.]MBD5336027.1 hypothetical protein [Bacteroides sp.]MBD5336741.1 hypothetical protein [Bacteroides sp.]